MTREAWREFICSPDRAGRHLSTIAKAVGGAQAEAIDSAVLQSFLERLRNAVDDVWLLGSAVDLITGGYETFVKDALHRVLDSLANEMVAQEEIVGPGLRGNPRWDRTLLLRMSGTLSPVHFVSRTAHRSFELPENLLLAWLVEDLHRTITLIEKHVGTLNLHPVLQSIRGECAAARNHHWFGHLSPPAQPSNQMHGSASRHRRHEYRTAAKLAQRRLDLQTQDQQAWWFTVMSLLAVNWLEPVSEDKLFELYGLVLTLDVITHELGFGEAIEYGLATARRAHVALFDSGPVQARVYFDQSAASILELKTAYQAVVARHAGVTGKPKRPDIVVVFDTPTGRRVVLIEMKKTADDRYISDSIYKVFGYLEDLKAASTDAHPMKVILLVPTGVSALPGAPRDRAVFLASGDDRPGVAEALTAAVTC
jgi:hypothetical protein